jgi:hypothetical protein
LDLKEEAAEGFAGTAAGDRGRFSLTGPWYGNGMGEQEAAADKAEDDKQEVEEAKQQMEELEEGDPPEKLEDWPGGKAMYQTYGGPDSESGYDEGPTSKLGPSDVEYQEDGSVKVGGEEVDNPEDFKGEPIPGGPTDPEAPEDPGETEE